MNNFKNFLGLYPGPHGRRRRPPPAPPPPRPSACQEDQEACFAPPGSAFQNLDMCQCSRQIDACGPSVICYRHSTVAFRPPLNAFELITGNRHNFLCQSHECSKLFKLWFKMTPRGFSFVAFLELHSQYDRLYWISLGFKDSCKTVQITVLFSTSWTQAANVEHQLGYILQWKYFGPSVTGVSKS